MSTRLGHRLVWLVLVLIAFAVRLWRIDAQDIWWDEARNIDVALRPLGLIPAAPELDIHPPGYFVMLHLWLRLAGVHPLTTRFFSLWFGVLLVPVVVLLSRSLGHRRAAWGAALYTALAPFLVSEAQETRMYTLAFVLVTLAGWWFWRVWQGHSRAWVGLGILLAASVLVHYSTVFVLVTWYAYAMLALVWQAIGGERRAEIQRRARDLFQAGLLAVLLFLPQLPRTLAQVVPYRNPNLQVPDFGTYVLTLWRAYTVGLPAEGPWITAAQLMFAALILFGLFQAFRRSPAREAALFVATSVGVPVIAYYAVLIDRATFAPRYISFVVPFLALLVGQVGLWPRFGRLATLLFSAVLVFVFGAGIYADQFNPAYFREDTSGLARWLQSAAGPDDVILIDVPYPLGFYYPRFSKDPNKPPPPEPPHAAPAYYLFVDVYTVADRLNVLTAGKRRVFWVQWYKSDTDPRGVVRYLLEKYGVLVGEKAFRGYQVFVYRVPQGVHFEVADTWEPTRVQFDDGISVIAARAGHAPSAPELADDTAAPRPVWVALHWRRDGTPSKPYKASVRLWDPAGHLIAQDDRRILSDRHLALPYWDPGEESINVYLLPLPLGTPPGEYEVTVRVYDPDTGQPVPVTTAPQVRAGVDAVVARVQVRRADAFPQVTVRALEDAPIAIVDAQLGATEVQPGMVLPVDVLWVAQADALPDLRVRLALLAEGHEEDVWEAPPVPWYPTRAWHRGEVVRSLMDWRLAPDVPSGEYDVVLSVMGPADRSWGEVLLGHVRVYGRPRVFTPPRVDNALEPAPQVGDIARLLGYTATGKLAPGETVRVLVVWQALKTSEVSYTAFVQILDGQNRVIAQEDHIPQRGAAPTTSWVAGEYIEDVYELRLPDALPAGPYRLIAGLYDARDMRRVPVLDPTGRVVGDHVVLHLDLSRLLSGR